MTLKCRAALSVSLHFTSDFRFRFLDGGKFVSTREKGILLLIEKIYGHKVRNVEG